MEGIVLATARKTARNAGKEYRHSSAANCACDTGAAGGRKALGVDPDLKAANQNRLRRIEGQIRGLQKMVEEDRHCAAKALQSGKKAETEAMYDELLELIYAHLR